MNSAINFENSIIILFAVTMLYVVSSSRLETYVKMLSAQGALLFAVAVNNVSLTAFATFGFIILETLIMKMIIIPWFLFKILRENEIENESEPSVPNFYSLVCVSAIIGGGFFAAYWISDHRQPVNPTYFGGALAVIMSALFIIMTRKKIITHIIAYIFLENGIFLLSLSVAHAMPFIVNLGIMLDIFVWVLLAGICVKMIKTVCPEHDIDKLKGLRG
jgi:hydrogenase-4 component E